MRIAALADIHGNRLALEAVLPELSAAAPDLVINLGDHLSGPLWAAATADQLMALDWIHLRGNHDRQLLDRPAERMGPSDRAADAELTARHREWLAALPATLSPERGILLCHGTPHNDLEYLLDEVTASGDVRPAPAALVRQRLGNTQASLVLCGHTHLPRTFALDGCLVVNPGSVGLPAYDDTSPVPHVMEAGTPHARFALLDQGRDGKWHVEHRLVEYDWTAASQRAQQQGRADWAHALATGRALR